MKHFFELRNLALVVICIVLNLGIGLIVSKLKLPFYLDSIGTVTGDSAWRGVVWNHLRASISVRRICLHTNPVGLCGNDGGDSSLRFTSPPFWLFE